MSFSRRHGLYALAGLAALGAGLALNERRLAPGRPSDAALDRLWAAEFDTPGGARLPLAAFRGRPLVVNFWATWCPPCVRELPELDRFARSAAGGWQVLGVAVDQADAVRRFLNQTPVSYPIVLAGSQGLSLVHDLGDDAGGLPYSLVIGADGRIQQRKAGATTFDELQTWARAGA